MAKRTVKPSAVLSDPDFICGEELEFIVSKGRRGENSQLPPVALEQTDHKIRHEPELVNSADVDLESLDSYFNESASPISTFGSKYSVFEAAEISSLSRSHSQVSFQDGAESADGPSEVVNNIEAGSKISSTRYSFLDYSHNNKLQFWSVSPGILSKMSDNEFTLQQEADKEADEASQSNKSEERHGDKNVMAVLTAGALMEALKKCW